MGRPRKKDNEVELNYIGSKEIEVKEYNQIAMYAKADLKMEPKNKTIDQPSIDDAGWTDYCIGLLRPEFTDKDSNPNNNGLRYLTETLLGPIIRSVSITRQAPSEANGYVGACDHEITIRWNNDPSDLRTYGSSADCYPGNCDEMFARHAVATAATRAFSRAMRQALRLVNVLAAEEVTDVPLSSSGFSREISREQIGAIDTLCKRLKISVIDFIQSGELTYKSLLHVSPTKATAMIQKLNLMQQKQDTIPENLIKIGYDPDWRKKFL